MGWSRWKGGRIHTVGHSETKTAVVTYGDGTVKEIQIIYRIDTMDELDYVNNGGILQTVLRDLAA